MLSNKTANSALYDNFFLEQTFNSPQMLAHSKKEIEWLTAYLQLKIDSSIIDVACGSGRHLRAFSELGYWPYGVDASADCVKLAKLNCPLIQNQIYEQDFLNFIKENFQQYNLVFIAGASFGYDTSLEINLCHLTELLRIVLPDGYLVIQYLNKSWANSTIKRRQTFWNETDFLFTLDKREVEENILKSEKIFISKSELFQKKYSDSVHMFTDQEIMGFVTSMSKNLNTSFEKIHLADSFSEVPFNEETSATPVLILKRSS